MSAVFIVGSQKTRENEKALFAEIGEGALDRRREKLLELYGDALKNTLVVADSLQAVALSLEAAIDRLAEVDAAMVKSLNAGNSYRRNMIA